MLAVRSGRLSVTGSPRERPCHHWHTTARGALRKVVGESSPPPVSGLPRGGPTNQKRPRITAGNTAGNTAMLQNGERQRLGIRPMRTLDEYGQRPPFVAGVSRLQRPFAVVTVAATRRVAVVLVGRGRRPGEQPITSSTRSSVMLAWPANAGKLDRELCRQLRRPFAVGFTGPARSRFRQGPRPSCGGTRHDFSERIFSPYPASTCGRRSCLPMQENAGKRNAKSTI